MELGANPLLKSGDRYKETALQKCEWRWKLFCQQRDKNNDDEKEQTTLGLNVLTTENLIFIRSMYLSKVLYVDERNHRSMCPNKSMFREATLSAFNQKRAQFSLKRIDANKECFAVLIKYDSLCYKELKSLDSCNHFEDGLDFSLSANTKDFTVSFVPYKGLQSQHWFIEKRAIGNDEGMTFCVVIKGKMYQLNVTDGHCLTINQVSNENEMEKEGRNLDDLLKAMFVICDDLKPFLSNASSNSYSRWVNYKSALNGNFENCQFIHQQVVNKLENAMKIQKLHGNTFKGDDDEKFVDNKTAKAPPIQSTLTSTLGLSRMKRYKPPKIVNGPPPGFGNNMQCEYGFVEMYDSLKKFGFIRRANGIKIFFHRSDVNGNHQLIKGQRVQFNIGQRNGRQKAVNVVGIACDYEAFVYGKCEALPHKNERKIWRRR